MNSTIVALAYAELDVPDSSSQLTSDYLSLLREDEMVSQRTLSRLRALQEILRSRGMAQAWWAERSPELLDKLAGKSFTELLEAQQVTPTGVLNIESDNPDVQAIARFLSCIEDDDKLSILGPALSKVVRMVEGDSHGVEDLAADQETRHERADFDRQALQPDAV